MSSHISKPKCRDGRTVVKMYGEDDDVAEQKWFMKCDMNYYIRETDREKHVSRPMH